MQNVLSGGPLFQITMGKDQGSQDSFHKNSLTFQVFQAKIFKIHQFFTFSQAVFDGPRKLTGINIL